MPSICKKQAEAAKQITEAALIATQSRTALLEEDATRALTLATQSWKVNPDDLAYARMLQAFYRDVYVIGEQAYTTPFYASYTEHEDQITSVAFSPESNYFATASFDGTVRLWNLDGEVLQVIRSVYTQPNNLSFFP